MTGSNAIGAPGYLPPGAIGLAWAGVLPFLALALAAWVPQWRGLAVPAFLAYAALILSFLGGVRWGRAMAAGAATRPFAMAVLPSLWGWLAWLAMPPGPAIVALALAFAVVAWWDVRADAMAAPAAFRRMRGMVSAAVVACHALALAALWVVRS